MKINLKKFDSLSPNQWDEKIFYRAVNIKFPHQLRELTENMYPNKIERINKMLIARQQLDINKIIPVVELYGLGFLKDLEESGQSLRDVVDEEIEFFSSKVNRLIDKYATCLKMLELRDKKKVPDEREWKMHGTTYYIDLNAGDDAAAGTAIGTAWLTLGKYTTTTVRTAGDIAKVRAGTSQVFAADLIFDEDGNVDALITIKGCSVADDPFSDASDVNPILDFNNAAYNVSSSGDSYWKFQNLDFTKSTDTSGCFNANSLCPSFDSCRVYGNASIGLYLYGYNVEMEITEINNCEFYSNVSYNIRTHDQGTGVIIIKNSIFNGGADTTSYGLYNGSAVARVLLENCSFGQTTSHGTYDYYSLYTKVLTLRNCIYNSEFFSTGYKASVLKRIYSEDDQQVFEAQKLTTYTGTLERETTIVRPGGADSSLKITPNSMVGLHRKISSHGEQGDWVGGAFKVWLAASVEKTITIYIRGFGWTGFPTASQLFVRASYLSNGASAARTEIDSNDVIADNTTWVEFDVTITPARTGFVYLDAFVAHYEASSGVYVSNEAPVT